MNASDGEHFGLFQVWNYCIEKKVFYKYLHNNLCVDIF